MNTNLHLGVYSSAVKILKQWLNNLVITKEQLIINNYYDHKMVLTVKTFQSQYNSPNPTGYIDNITLYNILVRVNPKQIDNVLTNNLAFRNILENLAVPYDLFLMMMKFIKD